MQAPSTAKQRVIDFVVNAKLETDYSFLYEGDTDAAQRFVHRMRVELSRLRKLLKNSGRTPSLFKVYIVDMIPQTTVDQKPRTKVVLRKTGSAQVEIDENLRDALAAIERGAK